MAALRLVGQRARSVRVYILDPAALATSSQALVSFWPYGDVRAGNVTRSRLIAPRVP